MQKQPTIFLSILIIACLAVNCLSYNCKQYIYNQTLLVLEWPAQFCYHHQSCKQNWKDLVQNNQWTIRGYWPASADADFMNCIQYMGHDPHCHIEYQYNQSVTTPTTKAELSYYWPQITTSNDIKIDQWNEHGQCYVSVIQTLNSSYINNEGKVFESYFKDSIIKAKNLKLTLTQQQYKTKEDLGIALGIKAEQFHAMCEYDTDYLSQVRVCYDVKAVPGTQTLTKCFGQLPNECEFPAKVRTKNGYRLQCLVGLVLMVMALLF